MPDYISYLRDLSQSELESEIDRKIAESFRELIDASPVADEMATTNATGFGMDDYEILDKAEDIDLSGTEVRIQVSCNASGDQDEDKPCCGDSMSVEATAVIDDDGKVTYEDVSTQLNWPDVDEAPIN